MKETFVLLVGGEKGGTGKTTLATNLAVYFALLKKEVLLIDSDPQGSSANFIAARNDLNITPQIACSQQFGNILPAVKGFKGKYDFIIIDAGGRASKELVSAMAIADLLLSPIAPSILDLETMEKLNTLLDMANGARAENLEAYCVMCRVKSHQKKVKKVHAEEYLGEIKSNFEIFEDSISELEAYQNAFSQGLGVLELKGSTSANGEFSIFAQAVEVALSKVI